MALYRLVCAFGQQSLVKVLTRWQNCPLYPRMSSRMKKHGAPQKKMPILPIMSGRVMLAPGVHRPRRYRSLDRGLWGRSNVRRPGRRIASGGSSPMASTAPPRVCARSFQEARLGNCLRHAINKLPKQLAAIALPVRKALRSRFLRCSTTHASAKVCACLRSGGSAAAGHHRARLGRSTGRVRRWFQDKKAGWYAVLEDPRMPATNTLLDQAHNAIERKLFMMKRLPPSQGQPTGVSHRTRTRITWSRINVGPSMLANVAWKSKEAPSRHVTGSSTCKSSHPGGFR